jgi:hypothetical protein
VSLTIAPISLREANAFVEALHRHHPADRGHKFSVSVRDESGELRGVAIAGRPKARMTNDGQTIEITRVCTDGAQNACSMLYGAVRRAAVAMGYRKVITYTLPQEGGASLRAAGFLLDGMTDGGSWSRETRPRTDHAPTCAKQRWVFEVTA